MLASALSGVLLRSARTVEDREPARYGGPELLIEATDVAACCATLSPFPSWEKSQQHR